MKSTLAELKPQLSFMVNLELNLRSSENEKPQDVEKILATALRTLNFSVLPGVDKPKYTVPRRIDERTE